MSPEERTPHDIAYGKRLRQLREKRGLTQAELVKRMVAHGIPYMNTSTLSRIEAGTRPVRLSEANVIVSIFGVDARYMTLNDDLVAFYAQDLREMLALHARFTTSAVEFAEAQRDLRRTRAGLLTSTDPETIHAVKELEMDFSRWERMDMVAQVREIAARVAEHEAEAEVEIPKEIINRILDGETEGLEIQTDDGPIAVKVLGATSEAMRIHDGEHQAEA